jgi:hypothetical protein
MAVRSPVMLTNHAIHYMTNVLSKSITIKKNIYHRDTISMSAAFSRLHLFKRVLMVLLFYLETPGKPMRKTSTHPNIMSRMVGVSMTPRACHIEME